MLAMVVVAGCNSGTEYLGNGAYDMTGGPGGGGGDGGAVPGGSITTPPVCSTAGDLQVTSGAGVSDFAWLWDTDHFVLIFSDLSTGDMRLMKLGADGSPGGPAQLLEDTAQKAAHPTLVKTPGGYLAAWEEGAPGALSRVLRVRALDPAGNPLGAASTQVAASTSDQVRPALSQAPGGAAIAWMDVNMGRKTVLLAPIDDQLRLGAIQRLGTSGGDAGWPSLSGDPTNLAAVWSDARRGIFDIRLARFDDKMTNMMETPIRMADGDARLGRLIRTSYGYLAAWEDTRSGDNEIYMSLNDPQGNKIAEGLVEEPGTGDANWPNMAWNGTSAGVVYYQFRGGAPQIYLSFIDTMGKRVGGGADVQVSKTPGGKTARYPDVAWTGQSFAVAWIDNRNVTTQVYFNRVSCQ
jgi:hypothetical protein